MNNSAFRNACVTLVVLLGISLRILYVVITPFDVRGHDYDGHLEYIEYVLAHGTIPPMHGGKEFYHPPLYYFAAAAVDRVGMSLHLEQYHRYRLVQFLSLFFSLLTFGVCFWVSSLLFSLKKQPVPWLLSTLAFATWPSFIFVAARINNDALLQLFTFTTFGFSLRFWQSRRESDWYLCMVMISLGLLTKSSMILFLLPIFSGLVFLPVFPWKKKASLFLWGVLTITMMTAWYEIPHYLASENSHVALIGNLHLQTDMEPLTLPSVTTFNPLEILLHPFNNPYSDDARRMFFWEYFYRSAFFGEFDFGKNQEMVASLILGYAFVMTGLVIGRVMKDVWRWNLSTFPLWSSLLVLVLGAFLFFVLFPYFSVQDFRYSLPLILPFTLYAVQEKAKPSILRTVQRMILLVISALSSWFMFALIFWYH